MHSHEVAVNCNGGPPRVIFAPLLGDVVMRATSARHAMCAPVSERHVCCFMLFPFPSVSVCSWVLPSHASLLSLTPLRHALHLLLRLTSRLFPLQLHSILFSQLLSKFCLLLFHVRTMDHSLSLPVEYWTRFICANPHVHRVHSVVCVQLDRRSISNGSNERILFIQHDNVSSSDCFLH